MYISYIYIYKVLRSCDTDLCLLPMACGQKLHDLPAKTMKTTAAFLKSRRILSENRRVFGICFFHRHLLRSFRHVLCVWCTSSLRSPTLYDDVVEMIFASLALCEGNPRVTASGTCCVCVMYTVLYFPCHKTDFHITGPFWGESTSHRWILLTKGQLWVRVMISLMLPRTICSTIAGDLRRLNT